MNSPPNMITSDELKSRVRSRLDGDSSSQSAPLSKVVHLSNWHNDHTYQNKNDQHSAVHCSKEEGIRCYLLVDWKIPDYLRVKALNSFQAGPIAN